MTASWHTRKLSRIVRWPGNCLAPGRGESQGCVSPERMLPREHFSYDKTCHGSSSLEKDDRCNAGTSSLGSIFGRYAESKFTGRCRDTLDPRSALPMTCDPSSLAPGGFGDLFECSLKVPTIFWNWRNFTASLGASTCPCPFQGRTLEYLANARVRNSPSLEEPMPRRLTRDTPTRPLRSSGHDRFILLHVSSQRVQYRLRDCHRNADLSAGFLFRLQGYRCVRRRLYLASMPGLGTPFHVSLPNVPSCCHRCPKIWVLPCMTSPP